MEIALAVVGIVVGILILLILIMLINALRLKPTQVNKPLPPAEIFGNDTSVDRFRSILQSKTVWGADTPGADHRPFEEFVPKLKTLYPAVFEALELTIINDYGILLRWAGSNPDAAPVVLMSHHDVVFANPEEWTHDPFAADIEDGRIYARGAVDTKCILAGLLEACDHLLAEGYTPPRDIYICSSDSEEDMGLTGELMPQYFAEKGITPLFVLDEGGAVVDNAPLGVSCEFAAIGVAEKGFLTARCTVNSQGGHAATPSPQDATSKLAAALHHIVDNPAPVKLSKPIEETLKELAAHGSLGLKMVFANLWLTRPLVLAIMKGNSETAAMVRTTYALTMLEGSKAANVIPKFAAATVNVRIDPHETVEIALERLKDHFYKVGVKPEDLELEVQAPIDPSPVSPFDDEVFTYLRGITQSVYPSAGIAPYVQSSCTDARHFARMCPHTYRFAGFLFKGDQRARIHGKDENLDVESFKRGVGFYIQLIANLKQLEG